MSETARFLIVEDEFLIAENTAEILERAGYTNIRMASTVDEAIAEIEKEAPTMVLTDIALGQAKSGIDLGALLHTQYKIPFIYITSHSSPEILGKAKHTRPNAYIIKPFKNEDLIVAIELALFNSDTGAESSESDELLVKEGRAMVRLPHTSIMWMEADGNYTTIHVNNQKRRVVRTPISELQEQLPESKVATTNELGLPVDWIEAMAFAWLAKQRIEEKPGNSPAVTGASRAAVLGGLWLPS